MFHPELFFKDLSHLSSVVTQFGLLMGQLAFKCIY
jgi:hypothetical protein